MEKEQWQQEFDEYYESEARINEVDIMLEALVRLSEGRHTFTEKDIMGLIDTLLDERNELMKGVRGE